MSYGSRLRSPISVEVGVTDGIRTHHLPLLLLAVCWICLGCARFSSQREIVKLSSESHAANQAYKHGLHAYEHGNLEKAASMFSRAIAQDPNYGAAYNNLGLVYFDQHKLALAASNFDMAIGLMPETATPLNNLGMALEAGGRLMPALGYYERATALEPENPLYLGNLVRARIRLGETGDLVRSELQQLAFIETRPDWLEWVDEQLALRENPVLDRGPAQSNPLSQDGKLMRDDPRAVPEAIELSPSFRLNDTTFESVELPSGNDSLPIPGPR